MLSALLRLPAATREEAARLRAAGTALALCGLESVADRPIDMLPYDTRRMAEPGRALLAQPGVLLLDEPAAGVSEAEMERLAQVIRDVRAMGIAVLLTDHHMDFLAGLADDVVVLDSGRVIFRGDMAGMRSNPAVIAAYLGEEAVDEAPQKGTVHA